MWHVREVTETDLYNYMCLYFHFDSICVLSELFELVSLLSQQFHAFKAYILLQNVVSITRYSNADAGADYTFYPLSFLSEGVWIPLPKPEPVQKAPYQIFLRWLNVTYNNFILDFLGYLYDVLHKQCLV